MSDDKIRNADDKPKTNDLQDPIIDKFEDLMDKMSQIDVNEMIKGINDMVASEEKDR